MIVGMRLDMRRLAVYITLLLVLAVSIATGYFASDWPRWCRRLGWCAAPAPVAPAHTFAATSAQGPAPVTH